MMRVAISAAAGVVAAVLAVRAVVSLLYQVSPYDPTIFSAVVLFLLGVGAAACYTPARQAKPCGSTPRAEGRVAHRRSRYSFGLLSSSDRRRRDWRTMS